MSKSQVSFPSFDRRATAIIGAHEVFDTASATLSDTVKATMQAYVDEVFLATGKRDQATCNAMGKAIRESQIVIDACEGEGTMDKRTFTNYAQSAMRALHWNVEWSPRLFQDAERMLPWSKRTAKADKAENTKGSATDPVKAGSVETTNDAALLQTLRKAIQQARILNRHLTVGILIDAAQELDPEFKE
jgi:hypothetical protein